MVWENDMAVRAAVVVFKSLLGRDITKGGLFHAEKFYLRALPPVLKQAALFAKQITSKPGKPIPAALGGRFRLSMKIFRVMGEDTALIRFIADAAAEFAKTKDLPPSTKKLLIELLQKLEDGFSEHHQFERVEELPGMGLK